MREVTTVGASSLGGRRGASRGCGVVKGGSLGKGSHGSAWCAFARVGLALLRRDRALHSRNGQGPGHGKGGLASAGRRRRLTLGKGGSLGASEGRRARGRRRCVRPVPGSCGRHMGCVSTRHRGGDGAGKVGTMHRGHGGTSSHNVGSRMGSLHRGGRAQGARGIADVGYRRQWRGIVDQAISVCVGGAPAHALLGLLRRGALADPVWAGTRVTGVTAAASTRVGTAAEVPGAA